MLRNTFRSLYYMMYGASGKSIKINDNDYVVSAHIARGISSEIDELPMKLLMRLSRNADTVFDVGANVGIISTIVAKEMKPGSVIYSFEPAPLSYKYLADTARVQKGNAGVKPFNFAVSNATGKLYFTNDGNSCTNHVAKENEANVIAVDAIALDSFCKQHGVIPDVIKVDIEGAEYWALQGMEQLLKENDIIVLMEIHSVFLAQNNITGAMFADIIDRAGYKVYNVDGREMKSTDILNTTCAIIARQQPLHAYAGM
ncbi:FkbM family methyltransferase [Nemorincola caseinilytica]|uniref:FkbM family methyltransferase n=1 Tax=Nemorincola caseinilytica TaxID=2054315 RepID=A0ABP8NJ08_9BACT